eukprot:TRINITY_DN33508_c0_g1_i1.p1 TRINITY_DN33508_c0_g1~~TRINITY_DN33508_c0_g1_i1.p1  ORF type:complete len:202 (-),score=22.95 TRINITY_DN33508_c0_g1_i1:98-622(-)
MASSASQMKAASMACAAATPAQALPKQVATFSNREDGGATSHAATSASSATWGVSGSASTARAVDHVTADPEAQSVQQCQSPANSVSFGGIFVKQWEVFMVIVGLFLAVVRAAAGHCVRNGDTVAIIQELSSCALMTLVLCGVAFHRVQPEPSLNDETSSSCVVRELEFMALLF